MVTVKVIYFGLIGFIGVFTGFVNTYSRIIIFFFLYLGSVKAFSKSSLNQRIWFSVNLNFIISIFVNSCWPFLKLLPGISQEWPKSLFCRNFFFCYWIEGIRNFIFSRICLSNWNEIMKYGPYYIIYIIWVLNYSSR